MLFGFALGSWNIDLLDIDLLDTDLVLLVGHGQIQIFPANILFISKTSSKGLQDMSSRRLQDVLEDEKLLRWRRVEDVFKTCLEDVLKTSWRPRNVCWDVCENLFSKYTKIESFEILYLLVLCFCTLHWLIVVRKF